MRIGDVLILTPKSRHGKNRIKENGEVVKVIHLQPGRMCVEHFNQGWRWIDQKEDEDFSWEFKVIRDANLDRTEDLSMKRSIGQPTDLLGNNLEST